MALKFSYCVKCFGRLRKKLTACKDCQSALWTLRHVDPHRNKTQSCACPAQWQSTLSTASTKSVGSDSEQLAAPQVDFDTEYVTMKRKMGSGQSSSKESPCSGSEERGNKKNRTRPRTDCTIQETDSFTSSATEHSDSLTKHRQKEETGAEIQITEGSCESKYTSGILTEPLMKTKDSLYFEMRQMLKQCAQRKSDSLTAVAEAGRLSASMQHSQPKFTVNSDSLSATDVSCGQLACLEHLPVCYSKARFETINPITLNSVFHSNSSILTSSLSLLPSRLYHSTSSSSATVPQLKQWELSLKDKDADKVDKGADTDQSTASAGWKESAVKENVPRDGSRGDVQKPESCETTERGVSGASAGVEEKENAAKESVSWAESHEEAEVLDDYGVHDYLQKLKQLPRQWELTVYGNRQKQRCAQTHHRGRLPFEFSLMTYNILAQNLLQDHHDLYTGAHARALDWKHRRELLMSEIACHNPDIMNLQEVNKTHFFGFLKPRLETLGYTGCYQKRTGDKQDGCATLWKKEKFEMMRFHPVEYCRGGLLDRDNIAIIVELKPVRPMKHRTNNMRQKATEDKIVVANTHLLFNPRRGDIKLAQLMILMAEIDKHAYLGPSLDAPSHQPALRPTMMARGDYCPVILTGDFNLEPHSDLYKFMISGRMDYEGLLLRQMSGQAEGRFGNHHLLERNFLSPMYGVTDFCQYHTAVADRVRDQFSHEDGSSGSLSQKSVWDCNSKAYGAGDQAFRGRARLWHHLNVISAYRHRVERLGNAPEVTTHHNRGRASVDYVFYSVDSKDVRFQRNEVRLSAIREGRLKLLARYGLMSARELDALGGIPNHVLPSDHLCLITRFQLK